MPDRCRLAVALILVATLAASLPAGALAEDLAPAGPGLGLGDEISFGWRPSFRQIKLLDETGEPVRGNGAELDAWRLDLKVWVPDMPIRYEFELEYAEKDVEVRTGRLHGGFGAHAFEAHVHMGMPIVLDRDGLLRLTPALGALLRFQTGGFGSFLDLPNRDELGGFLGLGVEWFLDAEDTQRAGFSLELGLVGPLHVARELGELDLGGGGRISLWWSFAVTDSVRFELRFIFSAETLSFRESRGLDAPLGEPVKGYRWDDSASALCLSVIAGL